MTLLHELPDFSDLLAVVGDKLKIDPGLVEKDYWIMHSLWGLQQLKYKFELKGGTSLSKGLGLIHRFSEDIDIRIEPPATLKIGKNHDKAQHIADRFAFYDDLASKIRIRGVTSVVPLGLDAVTVLSAHLKLSFKVFGIGTVKGLRKTIYPGFSPLSDHERT